MFTFFFCVCWSISCNASVPWWQSWGSAGCVYHCLEAFVLAFVACLYVWHFLGGVKQYVFITLLWVVTVYAVLEYFSVWHQWLYSASSGTCLNWCLLYSAIILSWAFVVQYLGICYFLSCSHMNFFTSKDLTVWKKRWIFLSAVLGYTGTSWGD